MEALGMASLPVTSGGKLFGAIYLVDLENIYGNTRIRKMARKGGTYLRPSSTVEEAWEVMGRNKTLWVPIVSGGKYIGAVTMEDILRSYQRELKAFRLHRSPS
jgi:CIC family chloride channel protein